MMTRAIYWFLSSRPYKRKTVMYKSHAIRAEVADGFLKQMIGLMYREGIASDEGMLFPLIFSGKGAASIIMFNMKFSIDIVWLDKSRRVVDIVRNAKPEKSMFFGKSYAPKKHSSYVLELKSGTVGRLGIGIGDELNF